ncbi:hypothetical protein T484DRAFT_1804937 [Baffinella frigidus]|nr:hypothetical protein T484DRAFT_1804937 [Cryptophyta sp. CCMP2293]
MNSQGHASTPPSSSSASRPTPATSAARGAAAAPSTPGAAASNAAASTANGANGVPAVRAGVGLSFHLDNASRRYIITDVHPNGPAGRAVVAGLLQIGDTLLAVDGRSVEGRTLRDIIDDILGANTHTNMLTS